MCGVLLITRDLLAKENIETVHIVYVKCFRSIDIFCVYCSLTKEKQICQRHELLATGSD